MLCFLHTIPQLSDKLKFNFKFILNINSEIEIHIIEFAINKTPRQSDLKRL